MKDIKTQICVCILLLNVVIYTKAQEKTDSVSALEYAFDYVGDVFANIDGGIQRGVTYLGMANLSIGFDTEKAGLWKKGEFFVNGACTHGGEPSANFVGDFQGASNIEAGDIIYLHELWFKQSINKLSMIIGLQDLNAEFAASDFGGMFVNSSFGIHSTIADNVPSPIFPLTRLGAILEWKPTKSIEFKAGVFDGLLSDYENNEYNTNWDLTTGEGVLYVGEIVYSANLFNNKPGTYKIGFYNHNHKIQKDENQNFITENNLGLYFLADQMVYNNKNNKGGLGFFTQLGLSDPDLNNHYAYLGFGLHYCGFSKSRCTDEIGLAVAQTWLKESVNGNETAVELSYKAILGDHIFVQPDFQYIINPAGTDERLHNAFVGILRFGISL